MCHCPPTELSQALDLQKKLEPQLIYQDFNLQTSQQNLETLQKFHQVVSQTNQNPSRKQVKQIIIF